MWSVKASWKIRRGLLAVGVLALAMLGIQPASANDVRTGWTGCYASSFIRMYHESSGISTFTHSVDSNKLALGTDWVGLTYTTYRNGSWEIDLANAPFYTSSVTCY